VTGCTDDRLIRTATLDESDVLSAIAYAAKAHWGYPRSVLATWTQDLRVSRESISRDPTFVCQTQGEVAGFCQLTLSGGRCELQHLWVSPRFMGRGIGRALLARAAMQAREWGVGDIAIDADPNAERFYVACGAVRTGEKAAPIEGEPQRIRPQLRLDVLESD
jgi:GNAT superfamily N-acetyltransferase